MAEYAKGGFIDSPDSKLPLIAGGCGYVISPGIAARWLPLLRAINEWES